MKKNINILLFLLIAGFSAYAFATNWKVKGSPEVKFTGGRISGTIGGLKADIQFDKDHPEQSKISASIDLETLATGFFIKTNHSKDALGADQFPTIKFVSTSVAKSGTGYDAVGKLTMKGATKPCTIHFTFEEKGNDGVFKGSMKVVPKEYGIDRSGTPDDVVIELNVPVTKG